MFSQSGDKPADQAPAPAGMRELPPQPAKPAMPAYPAAVPGMPVPSAPAPVPDQPAFGPDDSVIARDDHFEGTFTSRGTVVVMGSVKGRIEATQLRIEDGATVNADVIVDEAIIAGAFTGNLTCRERLEARASGRIDGRVETFKLMLHEGASVEGEMHMLTEAPKDAAATIRGSAPLRGESDDQPEPRPATPAAPAAKAAPQAPPSGTRPTPAVSSPAVSGSAATPAESAADAGATAVRSSVVETLRAETTRIVAPRTSSTPRGYGYAGEPSSGGNSTRARKEPSTTGF